jgi:putative ABC transport system permease protein
VVIVLALGIGANAAIFSVFSSVLLNPLPYKDQNSLVEVREFSLAQALDFTVSPGNYLEWQKQQTSFESIDAYINAAYDLTGLGEPERIFANRVTAGLLPSLGVSPLIGRTFTAEEDRQGNETVAVISHRFWQKHFNADTNAINRSINLDGRSYSIIGVMPESFYFPSPEVELWTPAAFTARDAQNIGGHYISAVARLKQGVTIEQASAEMKAIAGRLEQQYPQYNKGISAVVIPLHNYTVREVRPVLMLMLGAVGFVLLIVAANVANLQLARATSRHKEMAIRAALGASRNRVIRQLLTESIILSLAGGALGLLLAYWGVDVLMAMAPDIIPRSHEVGIDSTVLLFTLGVSLLTGIVFGLAPALRASKPDLNATLKEGGRTSTSDSRLFGLRNILVISEIALSLILLIGAGLMIRSFVSVISVDPGFNPKNVLTMKISLPRDKYADKQQVTNFYDQLLQRVSTLPGIESAGLMSLLPFEQRGYTFSFMVEGRSSEQAEGSANLRWASPDYFNVMQIPIARGRFFNERDRAEAPGAVIINQELARRYFADEDPIGKPIRIPMGEGIRGEIVGVVGDVHNYLDAQPRPEMYLACLQNPRNDLALAVRTTGNQAAITAAIRSELNSLDSDRPVSSIMTMEEWLATSIAQRKFNMTLLAVFAFLAVILAAVGIYGVMSYNVAQNTREIGIRLALGAQPGDVLKLILGQGLLLASLGVAAGLVGAFALTRLLESLLFGVATTDIATFITLSSALVLLAALACWIPARRATKVDPIVALRYE